MNSNPLISIITPTYNHELYIKKCIESVRGQTYTNWEQIIIDDGSTDETNTIIAGFDDSRIKHIQQAHEGVYKLQNIYNKALDASNGEFIAILEGDDFWPSQKLERQIRFFDDPKVILSFGLASMTNSAGRSFYRIPKNILQYENNSKIEITRKLLLHGNFIPACTTMIRKDALQEIGGFKQTSNYPSVDFLTWLELSILGEFCPINDLLGYWRRHPTQVTYTRALDMLESSKYLRNFLNDLPRDMKRSIGITERDLASKFKEDFAVSLIFCGRKCLISCEWLRANEFFRKAYHNGSLKIKLIAELGLICSYLKTNLEWAFEKMHMVSLKQF